MTGCPGIHTLLQNLLHLSFRVTYSSAVMRLCSVVLYTQWSNLLPRTSQTAWRKPCLSYKKLYLASTCTWQWTRQSLNLYLTHEKPGLTSLVTMTTRVWISHAISHSVTPRVLNKMDPQRCFPSGFFPWGFLTEILYVLLISPMRDTCPISIIPDLITLTKVVFTIPTKYCALRGISLYACSFTMKGG